jgi:hypothetical protein
MRSSTASFIGVSIRPGHTAFTRSTRFGGDGEPRLVPVGRDGARTALEQEKRGRPADPARGPSDHRACTYEPGRPAHRWSARSTRLPSRFVSPAR